MHWDPEHAYRLHIMCEGGQYLQYTWSWATNTSVGQDSVDDANVAVIDGSEYVILLMLLLLLSVVRSVVFRYWPIVIKFKKLSRKLGHTSCA